VSHTQLDRAPKVALIRAEHQGGPTMLMLVLVLLFVALLMDYVYKNWSRKAK
jgi:hypothetical protein